MRSVCKRRTEDVVVEAETSSGVTLKNILRILVLAPSGGALPHCSTKS